MKPNNTRSSSQPKSKLNNKATEQSSMPRSSRFKSNFGQQTDSEKKVNHSGSKNRVINTYSNTYRSQTSSSRQAGATLNQVADHIFKSRPYLLSVPTQNQDVALSNLYDFSQKFIEGMPKQTKLIYLTNPSNENAGVYKLFMKEYLGKLWYAMTSKEAAHHAQQSRSKANSQVSDIFHLQDRKCIEALLLQDLSKYRHPVTESVDVDSNFYYADVILNLIKRVSRYVESRQLEHSITSPFILNHLQHTLGALVDIDLFIHPGQRAGEQTVNYQEAKNLAKNIIKKVFNKVNMDSLSVEQIRPMLGLLHNGFLLKAISDETITDDQIQSFLEKVAEPNNFQELKMKNSQLDLVYLDKLNMIKNFLDLQGKSVLIPEILRDELAILVDAKSEASHGSRFEKRVQTKLDHELASLSKAYGHLVNPKALNASNPIMSELGLEADMMYEHQGVQCCFQVDGDLYHKYNRTGYNIPSNIFLFSTEYGHSKRSVLEGIDLRTLARDEIFGEKVPVCNYSDTTDTSQKACQDIMEHIIIPTYEAHENQLKELLKRSDFTAKSERQSLVYADQDFHEEPKQQVYESDRRLIKIRKDRMEMELALSSIKENQAQLSEQPKYSERLKHLKKSVVVKEETISNVLKQIHPFQRLIDAQKGFVEGNPRLKKERDGLIQKKEALEAEAAKLSAEVEQDKNLLEKMLHELKTPLLKRFGVNSNLSPTEYYELYQKLLKDEEVLLNSLKGERAKAQAHSDKLPHVSEQDQSEMKATQVFGQPPYLPMFMSSTVPQFKPQSQGPQEQVMPNRGNRMSVNASEFRPGRG